MEQVWCHEQNMAQHISHLNHLIFEGFQTHQKKMKLITETAKMYWLILDSCTFVSEVTG
jgi:hypothetical protein